MPGNKLGAGSERTIGQLNDLMDLLGRGDFTLLHFASHNVVRSMSTDGLYIPFGDMKFERLYVERWPRNQFRNQSPLVFMNCCASGGSVPLYTEMARWANSFLRVGAGAFIGSLWEIRDTSALTFAENFYDEVNSGQTLGESMRVARSALKRSDPTYLAYTLYGNPLARLS